MNIKFTFDVKISTIIILLMIVITLIEGIPGPNENYAKNKNNSKSEYISQEELLNIQNQNKDNLLSNDEQSNYRSVSFPNEKLPLIVEFYESIPDKSQNSKTILTEIQRRYEGKIVVKFIDVSLRTNYKLFSPNDIQVLPTQIIYNAKGNEIYRNGGIIISTGQVVGILKMLGIL